MALFSANRQKARFYADPRNYSFVVQGPIYIEYTHHTINSIHRHYHGAEVILSTWDGQNEVYIDPGSARMIKQERPPADEWNLTRHITSSRAGIEEANRPLVVKCRSDLMFVHSGLLSRLGVWGPSPGMFTERVVVGHLDTHKSEHSWFSLSDFVYLGTKQDLVRLFDIPFAPQNGLDGPERYIPLAAAKKRLGIDPDDRRNEISDKLIRENFVVYHAEKELGYYSQKYAHFKDKMSNKLMLHNDWQKLYWGINT